MNSLISMITLLTATILSWNMGIAVGTLLSIVFLVGIIYWSWSPKREQLNRHAAESILNDDDSVA